MTSTERFFELYAEDPEGVSFCPYRVCPLGAHVDHQLGKVTGFALDKGIHLAYKRSPDGIIELTSVQFSGRVLFHAGDIPKTKACDWADYLRGATLELSKLYPVSNGIYGVIEGTLPIGGLSSSAAVCIAFLKALCSVNGIMLSDREIISVALNAERDYVGVNCGKLDQSCEVYCKKDSLLFLDTLTDSYEIIPKAQKLKDFKIMILFSGIERNLAGSKFNMRVDECKAAAYAVKGLSGQEYGKFADTYLRNISYEDYLEYREKLPVNWRKRADHFFTESDRVDKGVAAWKKGDLDAFGKLIFESGNSSIVNYETGSPELKALYDIMRHSDGIYGGRFSGAGFKGCCMALADPSFSEELTKKITKEYLGFFPELKDKFGVFFCDTADGVGK